jgi:phenylalanyl-tRNA synthetase beta chain
MQLSDEHTGIVEMSPDMTRHVGKRYVDVIGSNDPVIEVKLTPNRPDCTGVRGIARDLAAAGLGKLKPEKKLPVVEGKYDCPIDIRLEFPAGSESACSCFAGRYVRGITNGPSPAWMQQRLKAAGQRPINAVVDVTNYVAIDRGRPLHVYDADKLVGAIRARLARKGETFLALDKKTYSCEESMCVIADDRAVLGLGGIIGGEDTGSTATTRNILIECAYFDPQRTAVSGREAKVQTEARYRFERGVDPAFIEPGLDLATAMMMQVAGGEPSRRRIAGRPPVKPFRVDFAFERVERLMGLKLPEASMRATLEALGFVFEGKDGANGAHRVTVPSWRPDVGGAADLVEEIARIAGLEKVPSAPLPRPTSGVTRATLTPLQKRVRRARRVLAGRGMVEAITWSFITNEEARHFGGGGEALELANPISSEMTAMRPGLLAGLLAAIARNANRGFDDAALFEVGQAYRGDQAEEQMLLASGVRAGAARLAGSGRHWSGAAAPADLYEVKADVAAVLSGCGFDAGKAQISRDAPAWYHPGKSAVLRLGARTVLAHFGELHPATLQMMGISGPAAGFEVFLDALPAERQRKSRAKPTFVAADLQPVLRDFAFLLDVKVAAADVLKAAQGADKALIGDVSVFDVYQGKDLPAGKKSMAIAVTLQPRDKTLTDEEIEAVARKLVAEVKRATGGEIRG